MANENGRLGGKVAVVTGAASGIGAAVATRLIAEGAHVLLTDIQDEVGADLAGTLGEQAHYQHCNVVREDEVEAAIGTAVERWGGLDVLHNNAGFGGVSGPIESTTAQGWASTMDVLLTSVFFGTKHAVPAMRTRGGGSIVNQSSTAAWMGITGPYGLTKAGVNSLTVLLAHELGSRNIRVNAIAPGPTQTAAFDKQVPRDFRDPLVDALAIKRLGTPDDHVAPVLFLLSDDAGWITGHVLAVDGGQITRI